MSTLQTLERGIRALQIVARDSKGVSVAELAAALEVHRAIAYRIVATLEQFSLVVRQSDGQICLGAGILELESRFVPQFRLLAQPYLEKLANETTATAFVSMAQGDECAAILVAEPEDAFLRVGYRVGSRHPLAKGAAGIAILAARPEQTFDDAKVQEARRIGYSVTRGELQKGAVGVASPILRVPGQRPHFEACVGVVAMEDLDIERSARMVVGCSEALAKLLTV